MMKVKTIDRTNLKAGFFKVCLLAMAIFSSFSWVRACNLHPSPFIPQNPITCNSIGVGYLMNNSNGFDTPTGYLVDVALDAGFANIVQSNLNFLVNAPSGVTLGTYAITGLNPSTTYYFRSRAYAPGCTSVYSAITSMATIGAPNPTVSNIGCGTAKLTWSPITSTFNVSITNSGNVIYSNNNYVGTSLTLNSLEPSTTYSYSVTANTTVTGCTLTSTGNFTTSSRVATPNANIASNVACYSFRANWNTVSDATGYYVDVATDPSFAANTFVSGHNFKYVANGNSNYLDVTGLTLGQTYYYRVSSANSCISFYSNIVSLTTAAPSIPTAYAATEEDCNSFIANWSSINGASGYYLEVATDAGFGNKVTGYEYLYIANGYTSFYPVTGLSESTQYHYRVSSADQCISWPSNGISIATTQCTKIIKNAPIIYNYQDKNGILKNQVSQNINNGKNNSGKSNLTIGINFEISPNPTASTISFTCESNEPMEYQLMDVQGKFLQTDKIVNGANISLDAYSKGIYILRVLSSDGILLGNKRIIKQ